MTIKPLGRTMWAADDDSVGTISSMIVCGETEGRLLIEWEDGRIEFDQYYEDCYATREHAVAVHEKKKAKAAERVRRRAQAGEIDDNDE